MRLCLVACAALLAAGSANAQMSSPPLAIPPTAVAAVAAVSSTSAVSSSSSRARSPVAGVSSDSDSFCQIPDEIGPVGVFDPFTLQAYVGYSYTQVRGFAGLQQGRSGFEGSISYFCKSWLGVEGTLSASVGTQMNERSILDFAGAGPRFRWAGPRALEFWAHALVGPAHYTPKFANSSGWAFGYETGIGVDALAHHRRVAYRLGLDMVGTHFFDETQLSPKVTVGVVWKF